MRNASAGKRISNRLYKTCRILAESGLLYTAASILNLITGFLGANPKYNLLSFVADIVVRAIPVAKMSSKADIPLRIS